MTHSTNTKPRFETLTFSVGQHYLSALVNGDWTGLDDADTYLLQDWFDAATEPWTDHSGNRWVYAHESVVDDSDEEFNRCEVCLLHCATTDITLHFVSAS